MRFSKLTSVAMTEMDPPLSSERKNLRKWMTWKGRREEEWGVDRQGVSVSIVRGPLCFCVRFILGVPGGSKKAGEEERVGILSWALRQAAHCPTQYVAALVA